MTGLLAGWLGFKFWVGDWSFCLHCHIQKGSEVHPASSPLGMGAVSLGESSQIVKLTVHLCLVLKFVCVES